MRKLVVQIILILTSQHFQKNYPPNNFYSRKGDCHLKKKVYTFAGHSISSTKKSQQFENMVFKHF